MTHICVGNLTIIGSDNGLSPDRRQAITWTNVGILLIWPLGTNVSEMLIEIHTFSIKKIHLKMSSGKWRPFCLGLNVLRWDRMSVMSHQINDDFTIYSTVSSCVHKHIKAQRYWSFVRGIHRWSVDSHHKGPITRKRSPCLDIIMRKFTAVRDTACSDQPTIENQRGTVGMLQYGSRIG